MSAEISETTVVDRSPELARSLEPPRPGSLFYSTGSVTVHPEDGQRSDPDDCPLANAFKKLYPWIASADISSDHPSVTDKSGVRHPIVLSETVVDWVGRLDRGEQVPPLTFTVGYCYDYD